MSVIARSTAPSNVASYSSEIGYVYLLDNHRVPNIVKIGYTNRTPEERAAELKGTGTPGTWQVKHHWKIPNAYLWEQRIHRELQIFRLEREFFELSVGDAKKFIHEYLLKYRVIGQNGLTKEDSEFENERLRKLAAENAAKEQAEKNERVKVRWEGHRNQQWGASEREARQLLLEDGLIPRETAPIEPNRPTKRDVILVKNLGLVEWFLIFGSITTIGFGISTGHAAGIGMAAIGAAVFYNILNDCKVVDPKKIAAYKQAKATYDREKTGYDSEMEKYNGEFKRLSEAIYKIRYEHFLNNAGDSVIPTIDDLQLPR